MSWDTRHNFVTCEYFFLTVNILEPGGGGGQCLSYRSLQERREGFEACQTSLKKRSSRRMRRRKRTGVNTNTVSMFLYFLKSFWYIKKFGLLWQLWTFIKVDLKDSNNAKGKISLTFMNPLKIYDLFVLNVHSNDWKWSKT